MAAEAASIPDPQTAWVWSTMMEAKIQALVVIEAECPIFR
jgi:hypothetical protein